MKGNPWFVANDIPAVLGFTLDNLKYHIKASIEASEGRVVPLPSLRGVQGTKVLSESGLYKLVMKSRKPEAKDFQNWVTQTVLPSIRKDGGYVLGEEKVVTGELSEDELILKVMQMQVAKVERDEAVAAKVMVE